MSPGSILLTLAAISLLADRLASIPPPVPLTVELLEINRPPPASEHLSTQHALAIAPDGSISRGVRHYDHSGRFLHRGRETLLNVEVMKFIDDSPAARVTQWRSPALNRTTLRRLAEFKAPDGTITINTVFD